ncbi:MAG: flagellar export chaperone FliS [Sedimentisphaerales bacterium]|nr:flagellar export chaperone FliS [Sedimentisphaerales bacterium]
MDTKHNDTTQPQKAEQDSEQASVNSTEQKSEQQGKPSPAGSTNKYLQTKVMTASPEQLQLMLYDGAIRFCEQARVAIKNKEIENSYKLLSRAEKIIMELCTSMKDEMAPETCGNMRSLYIYCYEQLVEANLKKEVENVDNALKVIRHMRETWIMLMEKLQEERAREYPEESPSEAMSSPNAGNPFEQPVGSTISLEG